MADAPLAPLRFGLGIPNGGDFADPDRLVQLAVDAEASGWDGFFVWDHVIRRRPWQPMVDPWVVLTAVAVATERLVFGPMVTPLARRRVSVVARQTATLDLLSKGRLRLGVGLGAPAEEFARFGEEDDERRRGTVLDESLEVLELLWSGEHVEFAGEHLIADGVQFLPRPVRGRVPIWVGGRWPGGRPFRRAARFDGVWPSPASHAATLDPDGFVECVRTVRRHRAELGNDGAYDACFSSRSPGPGDAATLEIVERLRAEGMTWWIENVDLPAVSFEEHRERVLAGPPCR